MISIQPCDPSGTVVALLFGGKSSERGISIKSAQSVAQGLRECGFEVHEIDTGEPHYIDQLENLNPDIVFNCLHGRGGEDGCVQGVCMELGLPFTGSGVLASALAMDKAMAKVVYRANGINTAPSCTIHAGQDITYQQVAEQIGQKMVLKPSCEGSALGVSIVSNQKEFDEALQTAENLDSEVVAEAFIEGTEVTATVVGNDEVMALPLIEIVPHAQFYDFEAKYAQGGADHICPARVSQQVAEACQDMAVLAHKALKCSGVSRTDIIVDGQGVPWVLETNTIPGMTSTSLIPDAARAIGIEFPQLCRLIVELGLQSFVQKQGA